MDLNTILDLYGVSKGSQPGEYYSNTQLFFQTAWEPLSLISIGSYQQSCYDIARLIYCNTEIRELHYTKPFIVSKAQSLQISVLDRISLVGPTGSCMIYWSQTEEEMNLDTIFMSYDECLDYCVKNNQEKLHEISRWIMTMKMVTKQMDTLVQYCKNVGAF